MRVIESVSELSPGDAIYYMERGRMVGPFRVVATSGARTPEHIVCRNPRNGVVFEQYAPSTVYAGECDGHESLDGAHMGESVYCDGTCDRAIRRASDPNPITVESVRAAFTKLGGGAICPHLTVAACDCAGKGSGRYLGRRPFAADNIVHPNLDDCGDDFAANGLCVRAAGHEGFHQDAHGHAWRQA